MSEVNEIFADLLSERLIVQIENTQLHMHIAYIQREAQSINYLCTRCNFACYFQANEV